MFYRGIYQCHGPYEVVKLPTIGGPSRLPNNDLESKQPVPQLSAYSRVELYDDLMKALIATKDSHCFHVDILPMLVNKAIDNFTNAVAAQLHWKVVIVAYTLD